MSTTPKALYRDEGIVLRTQKLGEADRIVTVLTRRTGKVRAVAKGVRRTKSKFGARLEPFSHVDLQLYQGRQLDIATQAEAVSSYGEGIVDDYGRYTSGAAMLEMSERLTEEREPAMRMFLLLVGGLVIGHAPRGLDDQAGEIETEHATDQNPGVEVGLVDASTLEPRRQRAASVLDHLSGERGAFAHAAAPWAASCAAWCSVVSASINSPSASPAITCGSL